MYCNRYEKIDFDHSWVRVHNLRECQLKELTLTHSSFSFRLGDKVAKRE